MRKLKLFLSLLMLIAFSVGNVWATLPTSPKWEAKTLADIADGSTIIIISNSTQATNIALPAAGAGTGNPPKKACTVSTTDGVSTITPPTGTTLQDLAWTLKKKTSTWQFFVEGSTTNCLYLTGTSSNTALRVGEGTSNNEFVMGDLGKLLKVTTAARFVGPYDNNGSDWRTYNTENATNYKGAQLTFYVLKAAACTSEVEVTKGAETNGTYTLSDTKVCGDGDGGEITISDIEPADGYAFDKITATAGTVDNENKKVTGITAATTITVLFKELQKYTVTFSTGEGNPTVDSKTEASAGAGITLPAGPTPACSADGWTFAGWAASSVASETTTAPALLSGTYNPTDDVTLYAVYKRSEGGGSATVTITPSEVTGENDPYTLVHNQSAYTIQINKNGGTKPAINATAKDARVYAKGTIVISNASPMTELVFNISTQGKKRLAPITASVGSIAAQSSEDETVTWTGNATSVTFTVGESAEYGSDGSSKAGQLDFDNITATASSSTTYYLSAPSCCEKHAITASGIGGELTLAPNLTEACANTAITLTANSPDGSHQGTGVIKVVETANPENNVTSAVYSGGTLTMPDYAITITATYAEKSTPSVAVSAAALDFGSPKKGDNVDAKKFTLTGSALEAGTLTLVAPSGYTVSPNEIAVSAGSLSAKEITVTPNTETAGTFNGNISISGAGVESTDIVALTMTVQETYTVNWFVNGTKIDANSITDVVGTAITAPSDFSAFTDCQDLTFVGWKEGSAIDGGSTTEAPSLADVVTTIPAANKDYYAVFAEGSPGSAQWEKATSIAAGDYLIVYEEGSVAFNGGLTTLDAIGNTIEVTISNNEITYNTATEAAKFTIAAVTGGYSIKSASGKYVGQAEDANGLATSATDDYTNAISISGGDADIVSSSAHLRYNSASNQTRFRYYKSASYTGQKAIQLYKKNVSPANFTKWYTICPHCNSVALNKAGEEHGTFALKRNSADVTSVNTCDDVTVDVVASPATGYELTNIALNGVGGATYNNGVITIPQDAEGTLTVTATFSQKNYSVTMAKYPTDLEGVTLSADQDKHYGDEVEISATAPTGYLFSGWAIFNEEDTELADDIASEIFTGDYAQYEYAKEAKFLMPAKNIVAEANFKKIYTVDEFMNNEFIKTNNSWYYVTGLVAEVPAELYNNTKMTYVISDDASKSDLYLTLYRGLGEDGENFSNVSDLAVGDRVIIYGQWSNQYKNMNADNYILKDCLTKKQLSSLEIVGDASVTTYDVGDSFDKTGLSVTATYNTGYIVENYNATITSDYDAPNTFIAGVNSVTVSASEGLINTEREIPVTVSSAVLDRAELAAGYQTEFWAKESYKEPLLNAYLSDEPATVLANVTGTTDVSSLDMSVAGEKQVTITYTRKAGQSTEVTYDFTVKAVVVDEAHAHSVATAREIIDLDNDASEDLDLADNATKTHVKGIVKSVQLNSGLTGGNAQYNGTYNIVITDEADATKEMTLYRVSLKSGITSVEENDLIKACGNLYWYESGSKYEINTGGQVVWKQPKASIEISNQTLEIDQTLAIADVASIEPAGAAVSYAIVENENNCITLDEGVIRAVTTGTATVSINVDAYGEYLANSKTFTVTVKPAAVHTSVVILAEYDGRYYALNNAAGTTEVQMRGGKVVVADEATKDAILWDRAEREGVATFYNEAANKYLNGSSGTTLSVVASEGNYTSWTWEETATKAYYTSDPDASTVRTFLYQSGQGIKNYAASNIGNSSYAQPTMYTGEIVVGEITTLRGELANGQWGTYCPDHNVVAYEGATFYTIAYVEKQGEVPYKVFYDEIGEGESLQAGQPYIFIADEDANAIKGVKVGDPATVGINDHGFIGKVEQYDFQVTADDVTNHRYYIVKDNNIRLCGEGWFRVGAERAYLDMEAGINTVAHAPAAGRRRVCLTNNAVDSATDIDALNASEAPVKVLINGELFILRGEKMYDAKGQLVK